MKLIAPLAPLWYMFSCAVDVIIILHYLTLSHSGTCSPVQLMSSLSYLHSSAHYHQCHNYLNILITITLPDILLLSCQKHYPNDHDYFILTAFNLENILLHTVELCLLIKCHIMSSDQIKTSSSD